MSSLSRKFTSKYNLKDAENYIEERRLLGECWEIGVSCGALIIVVRRRKLEK